jgi:carboxypeptidase C (cathepsin A)
VIIAITPLNLVQILMVGINMLMCYISNQPRYVGYSFGYGSHSPSTVDAANDIVSFINEWFVEFPEFVGRPVIISGESYAGQYMPAWANAILDYNNEDNENITPINLRGVLIGNGCINSTVQNDEKYYKFLHAENLIPSSVNPVPMSEAEKGMVSYIGYVPNYYGTFMQ